MLVADSRLPGSPRVSSTKGGPSTPNAGQPTGLVEGWEIERILLTVPQGISITNLVKYFMDRVGEEPGQMPRKEWIKVVRENASFGQDKLLRPKGAPARPRP